MRARVTIEAEFELGRPSEYPPGLKTWEHCANHDARQISVDSDTMEVLHTITSVEVIGDEPWPEGEDDPGEVDPYREGGVR